MLVLDRIEFQMFFTALCILRLIQLKTKGQTVYTALFSPESSAGECTKTSHFMFDGKYYDQINGVAMGSPLGPVLEN